MSSPAGHLQDYLEATLSEGQIDSQGSFSLSLVELLRKLTLHGFYHEANWSLFAVRALVRLGCQSLHLSQYRKETWLLGYADQQLPGLTELESQTPEEILGGQTGLALLARALGGLVQTKVAQVCLVRWQDGVTREVLPLHGGSQCPKNFPTIPRQGSSLGVFLRFSGRNEWDLAEHLAYAVQFCPVPVVVHGGGWWSSALDLRGKCWLEGPATSPAYPSEQLVSVQLPLVCDAYLGSEPAGPLLLKPCGGLRQAQWAAWSVHPHFDWLKPAGPITSISSFGRYYWGPQRQQQELGWAAVRKYMNSDWGDRGPSKASLATAQGDLILLVSAVPHPDQILPILDGISLAGLTDQLGIPGVTLITSAHGVHLDLSGTRLVQDQQWKDWLGKLRFQVKEILEQMTEIPPRPPVTSKQPSLKKTILATGGFCLVAGSAVFGLQPLDLFFFTHGGIFGGTGVAAGIRLLRDHLPQRWRDEERQQLALVLKERLKAAQRTCRQTNSESISTQY